MSELVATRPDHEEQTDPSTVEQRVARGKAARANAPRAGQASFEPPRNRPDPVALLESQAATRVPELVPIRHGRMAVSPFTFFRGAALVMANDLACTPSSGMRAQICGDAHLMNFGLFASPGRQLVFDVNDFDETLPGPWEWDVKRLAASLEIAARGNDFSTDERREITVTAAREYRLAMRRFAEQPTLDVWYARAAMDKLQAQLDSQLGARGRKRLARGVAKARGNDSMRALDKLTAVVDGELRILADPPLVMPVRDLFPEEADRAPLTDEIDRLFSGYRRSLAPDVQALVQQFRSVDLARKVVGVGSVGTRCWIMLMLGRDERDPLFLQAKEAGPSVLAEFAGASAYPNDGQRVVVGQRLMQATGDIFLGWQRMRGVDGRERDFYVRQLRDWKGGVDADAMVPRGMRVYAEWCGWTLARAHARTGDRIAIGAYLGASDSFERAIGRFAETYAEQNERDYRAFLDAIVAGRIAAEGGL